MKNSISVGKWVSEKTTSNLNEAQGFNWNSRKGSIIRIRVHKITVWMEIMVSAYI